VSKLAHACLASALCAIVLLVGCALGPNYKRPTVDSPAHFRDDTIVTNQSLADLEWWNVYQDPALQALIHEAQTNNYDLRIAITRVEQARAVAAQAKAQFMPSATYNGTINHGRNVAFGSPLPNNGATESSAALTLNAFWEVDLWGRVRRLNEAARAQFLASEEARRGVQVSLLSEVASAYFQLLELDNELEIAARATDSFSESFRIFNRRLVGGTASALETSRAEAALEEASAALPAIRQRLANTENQLSILLGRNPGPIERATTPLPQQLSPDIPAGLPSTLLERRPDIRETEQILRSATAQIGEAMADFFPKIGLTALLGRASPELSAFTFGSANLWGVGAEAAGPLFQGGRLVAHYQEIKAARDEARLRYGQTILNAFREVSDALVAREELRDMREHQSNQVNALEQAVKLSSERYVTGKASYYEVLETQQQLFPAQLNLARTERDQLLAIVSLYKALGGGWETENNTASLSSVKGQ
jgi:multidrug efflux system outer membrane protein